MYCRRLLLVYRDIVHIANVAMGPTPTSEHSYTCCVPCPPMTFIWYFQNKCVFWHSGITKFSRQSNPNANEWHFIVQSYFAQLTLYGQLVTLAYTTFNIQKFFVLPQKNIIDMFYLVLSTDKDFSQIHNSISFFTVVPCILTYPIFYYSHQCTINLLLNIKIYINIQGYL
jgi:hypothetical protein